MSRNSIFIDEYAKRIFHKKHSTKGVCPSCGHTQYVAISEWRRSRRLHCDHCGDFLVPSKAAQERENLSIVNVPVEERRCKDCNAKLRSGNLGNYCSVCWEKHFVPEE